MTPDWDEAASDELADIWVAATPEERDRIEAAVLRANRLIRDDPQGAGESRGGKARVLFVDQLTVWFRVPPGGVARVTHVRWVRPRRP